MKKYYYGIRDELELFNSIKLYIKNEETLAFIKKGFEFAKQKHINQKRKSGEPYFLHLISTAYFLSIWEMEPNVIIAGLLHDVIEDQGITKEFLAQTFNEDIANLVDGVTKLNHYVSEEKFNRKTSNLKKIILAMTRDVRVLMIKLADRLHNMLTLEYLSPEKQFKKSQETQLVYIPISARLGFNSLSNLLNWLTFRVLEQEMFAKLNAIWRVKAIHVINKTSSIMNNLENLLQDKVTIVNKTFRLKNIASIYKKMIDKNKTFNEIYDLSAIRIVVNTIPECYDVLALIQKDYELIPNRFKDYIAKPKSNGYRSIHHVIYIEGYNIEIQIRTAEMNYIAAKGLAAHWSYKEKISINEQNSDEHDLHLVKNAIKYNENNLSSNDELRKIVFQKNTYVLTPQGDFIELYGQATALDFAFRIHTHVGQRAQSAIINGKMGSLGTILKTGDIIEIKTHPTSIPNISWYDKCLLKSTKNKIRKFLIQKELMQTKLLVEKGKKVFNNYISKNEEYQLISLDQDFLKNTNHKSWDNFYLSIGKNPNAISKFINTYLKLKETKENVDITKKTNDFSTFIIDNHKNIKIEAAKCCHPIPGDIIIGYVTKQVGIRVHRQACPNLNQFNPNQIIKNVSWNQNVTTKLQFITEIIIQAQQTKVDILKKISQILITHESILLASRYYKLGNQDSIMIQLSVKDTNHLTKIINALNQEKRINSAIRK